MPIHSFINATRTNETCDAALMMTTLSSTNRDRQTQSLLTRQCYSITALYLYQLASWPCGDSSSERKGSPTVRLRWIAKLKLPIARARESKSDRWHTYLSVGILKLLFILSSLMALHTRNPCQRRNYRQDWGILELHTHVSLSVGHRLSLNSSIHCTGSLDSLLFVY